MTNAKRLQRTEQSMTRQQILHDAAKAILAIQVAAEEAFKAAGGESEEFYEQLDELLTGE